MVEDSSFKKVLEWMETLNSRMARMEELQQYHSQKLETVFDVLQEMRDDLRMLKRTVVLHEDEINELKKHIGLSKH
ncbi:MAG: hypothetical protein HYU99_06425 [Deltaproteobacteria bacterium]|nr:hypothetical protein [Deltaproteobacteria bacterium]